MGSHAALLAAASAAVSPAPSGSSPFIAISSLGRPQHLPTSMCKWPVWITAERGSCVTLVPGAGELAPADDLPTSWVDPVSYNELWLPNDLHPPSCHLAVGAVLKDGAPRYLFPCVETALETRQRVWYNRGLNSLPLGKTWLQWGSVPLQSLRITAFERDMARLDNEGSTDQDASDPAEQAAWEAAHAPVEVAEPLADIWKALSDAPSELSSGFHFLVARLDQGSLPKSMVRPGKQLRVLLTDNLVVPDPNVEDWELEVGCHGECEISLYAVPPGRDSKYMPQVYHTLYKESD